MKYYIPKDYKVVCVEGCYHIKNIQEENLLIYESLDDAIEDGCRPCTYCCVKLS